MKGSKKKCLMCNKPFVAGEGVIVCSDKCKKKYIEALTRHTGIKQTCKICGKEFVKDDRSPFCSNECRQASIAAKQKPSASKLSKRLSYCKEQGMTYAELQMAETLEMIGNEK